jgi:hypothetical protein
VDPPASRYPRRAVLAATAAGLAASVTGCDLLGPDTRWRAADPLAPLLMGSIALADRYEAIMTAVPPLAERLRPIRDAHRAHAVALAREVGLAEAAPLGTTKPTLPAIRPTASPTPVRPVRPAGSASARPPAPPSGSPAPTAIPTDPATALAQLVTLERSGQELAAEACLAAPSYRVALLCSITAGRASHLEALR